MVLLLTCLPGQNSDGSAQEDVGRQRGAKGQGSPEGKVDGKAEGKMSEEEWARLTPEQRLARNITHGASAYCKFQAVVKPAKLMPGQTGTVVVSAILVGAAVLPAPAPMEMVGAAQQGLVTLGSMTVLPATMGKLAKGYLGRPVYDNYAVMEVPITVAANAEVGKKQAVSIDLRFDLYDGNSAQPVSRFFDRVSAEVEIGRVADPVVQGLAVTGVHAGNKTEPVDPAAAGDPSAAPKAAREERVITAVTPTFPTNPTTSEPARSDPAPAPLPVDAGESGLPLPYLIGGGVLVGLILLLLLRKK